MSEELNSTSQDGVIKELKEEINNMFKPGQLAHIVSIVTALIMYNTEWQSPAQIYCEEGLKAAREFLKSQYYTGLSDDKKTDPVILDNRINNFLASAGYYE